MSGDAPNQARNRPGADDSARFVPYERVVEIAGAGGNECTVGEGRSMAGELLIWMLDALLRDDAEFAATLGHNLAVAAALCAAFGDGVFYGPQGAWRPGIALDPPP